MKFENGTNMGLLKPIKQASARFGDYYFTESGDILYGEPNGLNITEWWVICGSVKPEYIGYSLKADGNKLVKM